MNIFQGLDSPNVQQSNERQGCVPLVVCSGNQVLVAATAGDSGDSCSITVSAVHTPQQTQASDAYSMQADVQSLHHAGLPRRSQVLCACAQVGSCSSTSVLNSGHGSRLLVLCKLGCSLQLYALPSASGPGGVQLLAELQHEGFKHLQPHECCLLPGPLLLLQPEPGQLLVMQPAGQQSGQHAATNCEPAQPSWQLLQLDLPAEALLDAAAAAWPDRTQLSADPAHNRHLATCLNRLAGKQHDVALAAVGPWRLLHSSGQQHSSTLELLLALPVAEAGAQPSLQHTQQQQRGVLLCMLQVDITCSSKEGINGAAATAEDEEGPRMAVSFCQLLDWQSPASAAAVYVPCSMRSMTHSAALPESGHTRLAAVASEAGGLQVLRLLNSSSSSGSMCTGLRVHGTACRPQPQQQQHRLQPELAGSQPLASHQLQGAVRQVVHLPRAFIGDSSHSDVLAVLHEQRAGSSAFGGSMAVTLLQLNGSELKQLAVVPAALGLCAPAHAPAGMVCPFVTAGKPAAQQQQQQQTSHTIPAADALQVAAVILLSSSSSGTEQHDSQALSSLASDLRCCAVLEPKQGAASLPGPLLCVLAQAPDASTQQAAAGTASSYAAAADAGGGRSEAAQGPEQASSELQGLQTMLAALERRWQHDTRELCALQHQVDMAQRLAAAGHMQLCQLAADTLYRSSIRQYVLPVNTLLPDAALAVYKAGRRLAEEQQQQQQRAQGEREQRGRREQAGSSVAVLQHPALSDAPTLQLLLQAASVRSKLAERQLHLEVVVEPVLQAVQPNQEAAQQQLWRGALLQPHHAEVLVWHAQAAGITAASSWAWDLLTGQLTATVSVPVSTLLQAHNSSSSAVPHKGSHGAVTGSGSGSGDFPAADSYTELAQALAASAGAGDAAQSRLGGSNSSSSVVQDSSCTVCLYAAVVVSASCSSQAIVQWESQQHPTATQAVLQRSQLLSPVLALLHLQPVEIPTQDLLLHQLLGAAGTQPGSSSTVLTAAPQRSREGAGGHHTGAVVPSNAVGPTAQTPVKHSSMGPMQANGGLSSSPGFASGLPGVVPPTPCSADGSAGELGVIPDSQDVSEDAQHHVTQQQLQEWWQTQLQRQEQQQQRPVSAATGGEGDMDWEAAAQGDNAGAVCAPPGACVPSPGAVAGTATRSSYNTRHLLLRAGAADLTLLPMLLQQRGFEVVQPASSVLQSAHEGDTASTLHRLVLQVRSSSSSSSSSLPAGARAAAASQHSAARVELLFVSAREAHVMLLSPPVPATGLDSLEQLLLLAVRQLPGGHTVAVERSCLDPVRLARLAAAATSLTDATHKHAKVLELVLQSVPDSMTRGAAAQGAAAQGAVAQGAATVAQQQPQVPIRSDEQQPQLVVSGRSVGPELSQCWVSCMQSQAEVDLAICQLSAAASGD